MKPPDHRLVDARLARGGDSLEAVLVIDALAMATSHRSPATGAIHHSDRGSQYGAAVYGRTLGE